VIETHPGGGLYDCLTVLDRRTPSEQRIDLNREGSAHVQPFAQDQNATSWPTFWDEFISADDPRDVLRKLCETAGLPPVTSMPPSTPTTLTYRVIAGFLAHAAFGRKAWECRNGFDDTSGYGGGVREDYFTPWAEATRLAAEPRPGLLHIAAYDYWFLVCDGEPMACLNTSGEVWDDDGQRWDLMSLYSSERRIWPVISVALGRLLP
jgi:hypothetical protein